MKSVMLSIKPKWVEKIVKGEKTIEVRKSRPKIETPFKCYIYCTHNNCKNAIHTYINSGHGKETFGVIGNWRSGKDIVDVNFHLPLCRYNAYLAEGKVIGEFLCERIVENFKYLVTPKGLECACLSEQEVCDYLGLSGGYGWHISDLKIYDKPKKLGEFRKPCPYGDLPCSICPSCDKDENDNLIQCFNTVSRPPQSWCYVEEL